jgi:hypothetical protein
MQRRLLLGLGAAVVLGGLALVPLDVLTPAPSKPLFLYLTPLVRVEVSTVFGAGRHGTPSCTTPHSW